MLRQLIVNADDFGLTEGVSRGIIRAHLNGIVSSTSVMVNFPASEIWVPRALEEAPDLGMGLHLTLSAGNPVTNPSNVPGLVDDDQSFHHKNTLVKLLPTLDLEQIETELRSQIARFEALAGRPPDHLDSHHHVTYLNPSTAALMIQLATELSVPIRNPLTGGKNNVTAATNYITELTGDAPNRGFVEELVNVLQTMVTDTNVSTPDTFINDFFGDRAILGELLLMLLDVEEGVSELMCHPGEVDRELETISSYTKKRTEELEILTHIATKELIQAEFIQLITFGDIKN